MTFSWIVVRSTGHNINVATTYKNVHVKEKLQRKEREVNVMNSVWITSGMQWIFMTYGDNVLNIKHEIPCIMMINCVEWKENSREKYVSKQCRCNWFTILTKLFSCDTNFETMELFQIKMENISIFMKKLLLFRMATPMFPQNQWIN